MGRDSSPRRILALLLVVVACASGAAATVTPEPAPTPCSGAGGVFDGCPPGHDPTQGCTTPKLSVHGQSFASGDPSGPAPSDWVAPGLAEDAEIAAIASHADPANGGLVTVYVATVEAILHIDPLTQRNCIIRKHIRVWRSQNTTAGAQQGTWAELTVPDQLALPDLPGVTDHWISDPALAVDPDGYVYLAAVRVDPEQDCTTNNANGDVPPQRILLYVANPEATAFETPIEVSTESGAPETTGVDHPEIAASPTVKGQVVVSYWHDVKDGGSDRLVTLQRVPFSTTFELNSQGDRWISRCFITPTGCLAADTVTNGNFETAPRVAFSDAGNLFLAFAPTGSEVVQRLQWTSTQWVTSAAVSLPAPTNTKLVGQSEIDFHATFSGAPINLAPDWTPGLAVGNVAANSDPIVYLTFDAQPISTGGSFADDRQVFVFAVNGSTDLSIPHWHAAGPAIPHAFHSSVSMSGPANVADVIYMQVPSADLPTSSLSTHIQTVVQRIDASRLTRVAAPLTLDNPPTIDSLPSRHGESTIFSPGSLFAGEYVGIATLGVGFAAAWPGLHPASNATSTVQALLNVGSQKCDPPSTIAINRPDSFWQCDNCNCGADGVHDVVGCIPGSVTDAATVCATLCGGTVCGESLSCAHSACVVPTSGATATLLGANTCNTREGPYLGSEPSLFGDYVANDDGTSGVTLAKAGHVFSTAAPGAVSFNLSESPATAGRQIEIARIDLQPSNFDTGGFKIGPIVIEPAHHIHDLRLIHGERLYGVFSDATHFQLPSGAADFFAVGFDGTTASQQFQSNTAPINGTFDPVAGTFSLDLVVGDPTTDGAEATFHGTLSRTPSYNCAAGIAPVFAPLTSIMVEPCFEGAPVFIPLPRVSDLCTPHDIRIVGQVISVDGKSVSPIPMKNDLITVPSSTIVVLWTATDANGTMATAQQTVSVRSKPALFAEGKLEVDNGASILSPLGSGAALDNGGTGAADETVLHNGATSGSILSIPSVKLLGSMVSGSVQSGSGVQNVGASVTGPVVANSAPALPSFPQLNVTFPAQSLGDVNVQGGTRTLAPGSYGNLSVASGATLSLRTGTYFFKALHVSGALNLDTSAGAIQLDVQSSIFYDGSIVSNGDPSRFVLGYVGSQPVLIHSAFSGVIIAPNATLQLGLPKGAHTGAFFAGRIQVLQGVQIKQAPFACTLP